MSVTGGRVLVGWGEEGLFPRWSAAVDLVTGNVTAHDDANQLLPQCDEVPMCTSSRVVSATPTGPLVAMGGGGFGIPGRWFSEDVLPMDIEAETGALGAWNGSVYSVADGHALVGWYAGGSLGNFDHFASYTLSVHPAREAWSQGRSRDGSTAGGESPTDSVIMWSFTRAEEGPCG